MHTAACRLPDKASDLILLAVKDLEKSERSPVYEIDMGMWHKAATSPEIEYDPDTCKSEVIDASEPCVVCFAGSVMAHSLAAPVDLSLDYKDFSGRVRAQMLFLNSVCCGNLLAAFRDLHAGPKVLAKVQASFKWNTEDGEQLRGHVDYVQDAEAFKREMRRVARKLARIGL